MADREGYIYTAPPLRRQFSALWNAAEREAAVIAADAQVQTTRRVLLRHSEEVDTLALGYIAAVKWAAQLRTMCAEVHSEPASPSTQKEASDA